MKFFEDNEAPLRPCAIDERRSEPRFEACGEVVLLLGDVSVPGRLLDISDHGMRVEHMYSALTGGEMLQVRVSGANRTARVVWSRIRDEGVESGFYLL